MDRHFLGGRARASNSWTIEGKKLHPGRTATAGLRLAHGNLGMRSRGTEQEWRARTTRRRKAKIPAGRRGRHAHSLSLA